MVHDISDRYFLHRANSQRFTLLPSKWLLHFSRNRSIRYEEMENCSRMILTLCRLCCAYDCSPHCFIHIQAQTLRWRGRTLSIPILRVHGMGNISSPNGFFGLHQQLQLLRARGDILLFTCTTILVSTCLGLDPSIHHFHIHSYYICLHILLCPV